MGHPEKLGVNGIGNGNPSRGQTATAAPPATTTTSTTRSSHHAIKIIPEDVELSTGLQRSRSSSVQLHVPLMSSFTPAGSQQQHQLGGGGGGEKATPIDLDLLAARDAMDPPLPSPSLMKPFQRHHYPSNTPSLASSTSSSQGLLGLSPNQLPAARRKGLIYAIAIVAGCIALVLLLVLVLSRSSASANSRIAQHALHLSSSSSRSLGRLSSYVGSYLPFLDSSAAFAGLTSSAIIFGHANPGVHTLHPILPILRQSRAREDSMLSSQSTSYAQLAATYRKRYKTDPPKGFEKWWSFAKARNHTLVDEYDSMMRDLAAFKVLSPEALRLRTRTLGQLPGVSLITIKNGQAQIHSKSGKWAPALALQEMMNAFVAQLPDMEIAVNEKPEGRVLPGRWVDIDAEEWADEDFAREINSESNQTDPLAAYVQQGSFKSDWRRDGSVWEAFRRACPPDSAARRLVESVRSAEASTNSRQMRLQKPSAAQQQQSDVYFASSLSRRRAEVSGALPRTRELSFNPDVDAKADICSYPSLHALHSAFFSDTRSIGELYPLFSPSKPTGFADLLIPFHQYWSPPSEVTYENDLVKGRSKTPTDPDWAGKDDKVYWRGKYTRGAETPAGHFSSFQKPRLVSLANDDGATWSHPEGHPDRRRVLPRVPPHRVLVTVNATSSSLVSMSAPGPKINDYVMDVALACDPVLGECQEQQRQGYRIVAPGPLSEYWKHKYIVDLDEVGLSPKFPAVMESKSAVVKASVQREFWEDWIVPWYHYIPLSSSYAELYNIQAFFSGFPKAFQNRRSTSASAPKQDETPLLDREAEAVVIDDPSVSAVIEDEENPNSLTLKTDSIKLKPVNPAHGDTFDGDLALKDIAEQGARWRKEHLRREDMEVYVFRLLLEWARLLGEDQSKTKKAAR